MNRPKYIIHAQSQHRTNSLGFGLAVLTDIQRLLLSVRLSAAATAPHGEEEDECHCCPRAFALRARGELEAGKSSWTFLCLHWGSKAARVRKTFNYSESGEGKDSVKLL